MTTDPNHERVRQLTVHPVWCDPTLCTAPRDQMTNDEYVELARLRVMQHVSTPVELAAHADSVFDWRVPNALLGGSGYVWLTQGFAPWKCNTILRLGPWMGPGKEMSPLALFSIELEARHRISSTFPMSPGERLAHVIEYAFVDNGYPAPESLFVAIESEGANGAGS